MHGHAVQMTAMETTWLAQLHQEEYLPKASNPAEMLLC